MKLLNIYEQTITGDNNRLNDKVLVHHVVVETKEELMEVINLLNAQSSYNKENCNEKGDYKAFVIELKSILPAYTFINHFVNLQDARGVDDYAKQINKTHDNNLVMLEE